MPKFQARPINSAEVVTGILVISAECKHESNTEQTNYLESILFFMDIWWKIMGPQCENH